jgi:hypothetical protein
MGKSSSLTRGQSLGMGGLRMPPPRQNGYSNYSTGRKRRLQGIDADDGDRHRRR